MTNYKIDIVSDVVCPWCYVGWKRLSLAMQQHQLANPGDSFTTIWHAYQLVPEATKSMDKQAYYDQRFGAERARSMQAPLQQVGRQLGIEFKFGGKTGNTRDSHRLEVLAKTKGPKVQAGVFEVLANAYFEQNEDITDTQTLISLGIKAGLPPDEVRDWMTSDKGNAEVDADIKQSMKRGITGVPNYTINDLYEVSGAQPPSQFQQIFDRVKQSA